jgi:hypothetical protein
VKRTSLADLAALLVVVALVCYFLLRIGYDSIPPLDYVEALPIAALGVLELIVARRVRLAVRHVRGAKPVTALAIARCVALGKASATVWAGLVGACAGLLVRVLPDAASVRAAANDSRVGSFVLAASVLLVVAALLLERAGVAPRHDRDIRPDDQFRP